MLSPSCAANLDSDWVYAPIMDLLDRIHIPPIMDLPYALDRIHIPPIMDLLEELRAGCSRVELLDTHLANRSGGCFRRFKTFWTRFARDKP